MQKATILLELVGIAFLSISCSTIAYVPKLSMEASQQKINRNVKIEPFIDSTPINERNNPIMGTEATATKNYNGNLSEDVTLAVLKSFDNNNLFTNAKEEIENPDYIIKGEIIKFRGYIKATNYSLVSILSGITGATLTLATGNIAYLCVGAVPASFVLFGLPTSKTSSEVIIVLHVYDKNNNLIKSYTGKATNSINGSMYKPYPGTPANDLNLTFSYAVNDVRKQILEDSKLY